MTASVTRRIDTATVHKLVADGRRSYLRGVMGVDADAVASTDDAGLYDLIHAQLRLRVEDATPREPANARLLRLIEDSSPDELASVLTFTTGRLIQDVDVLGFNPLPVEGMA